MAWEKLQSVTATESVSIIGGDIASRQFLNSMYHGFRTGAVNMLGRYNNDGDQNYSTRRSVDGIEATTINRTHLDDGIDSSDNDQFKIFYAINIADEVKQTLWWVINRNSLGAGIAPRRSEGANKWVNSSIQVVNFTEFTLELTNGILVDSNITTLGTD